MAARKAPPPNKYGVEVVAVDERTKAVRLKNPVHGPITPDEALNWAAHLIHCAGPLTKTKVADLLKAIQNAK